MNAYLTKRLWIQLAICAITGALFGVFNPPLWLATAIVALIVVVTVPWVMISIEQKKQ